MYDKQNKTLITNQKLLQNEGERLLAHTKLLEVLKPFGELLIGGSYAYGTMVDRDIDIHVIHENGKLDRNYRNKVIQALLEIPDIGKLNIVDLVNFSYGKTKKAIGIWLGLVIIFEKSSWNIDIWLFDKENMDKNLSLYSKMMQIDEATRSTILAIKNYCFLNGLKQKGITSVDIYNAVIDEDIKSVKEYLISRNLF